MVIEGIDIETDIEEEDEEAEAEAAEAAEALIQLFSVALPLAPSR
jgi:hypothetical protein